MFLGLFVINCGREQEADSASAGMLLVSADTRTVLWSSLGAAALCPHLVRFSVSVKRM